jgi:1,4-dihydroxy-2-naphthoate octaprenyltransferase
VAAIEPTIERLSNPLAKYFQATRPPFLTASLVPCLVGFATASYGGVALNVGAALLTLLGALLAHAGINVLNDYYDARNGTDGYNTERLFPFTGGSRFIQNGVLSERQTLVFGLLLMVATMLIGLSLVPFAGNGLFAVGAVGLFIGWAYSAPPFALNSRGLGEMCVALGFGSLITVGADMVQRGHFDALPLLVSAPYALLVAALLYVNQFPDRVADAKAGKRHWVVRLGPDQARWGYLLLVAIAYGFLLALLAAGIAPAWSALALLPLPLSLLAARDVLRYADRPARLVPAIQRTIGAMVGHGSLLALGLWVAAR